MTDLNGVVFGWGATPMREQHPVLGKEDAEHFDRDNTAIIRLHLRGLITTSQRDAAFKKLTRKIEDAIRTAIAKAEPTA